MTNTVENVFSDIYQKHKWAGGKGTRSGSGSTVDYTKNLREELPKMLNEFNIQSMLDAPCGDMAWMSIFLEDNRVSYIGADIVPSLIQKNVELYPDYEFLHLDITKDKLPKVDMLFCRDCLFHLSYDLIDKAIENFLDSGIEYLFTTTHINSGFENKDILPGDFRLIDLFSEPFNFPKDVKYRITDYIQGYPEREMILITRDQLKRKR